MHETLAVHGNDIIELVTSHPQGIRLGHLVEIVTRRYGTRAAFHTCSAAGMNLDKLLALFEARQKVRISCGVVYPGARVCCGR